MITLKSLFILSVEFLSGIFIVVTIRQFKHKVLNKDISGIIYTININ